MNQIRILPIVIFAITSLFVLKTMGLMRNGHYTLHEKQIIVAGGGGGHGGTNSLAEKLAEKAPPKECAPVIGNLADPKADNMLAVQLVQRRKELDERLKEIELRESILAISEKKLAEAQEADRPNENANNTKFQKNGRQSNNKNIGATKSARNLEDKPEQIRMLIGMYDNMKAKDAGAIFDKLDMSIMSQLALELKPAKMAEIMSAMSPEIAQKLTTELANQGKRDQAYNQDGMTELPKIEGLPPKT